MAPDRGRIPVVSACPRREIIAAYNGIRESCNALLPLTTLTHTLLIGLLRPHLEDFL
jgi:hypothetical protein